ncbi:MAG: GNAT family N-acetyltransferase [Parvibaculum sp.]|nr:GNAT family N-acetyltransferase [Parvibaculum sp.]
MLSAYERFRLQRAAQGRAGIEWLFESRSGELGPFCVARSGGEIVGLSSYVPARIKLGSQEGQAYQAVDSYTAEQVRGMGLFGRLARSYGELAERNGADVIWGFPNRNAAPAWFGRLGWCNLGQVPFLIKPLRAGYLLRRLGLSIDFRTTWMRDSGLRPIVKFDDRIDGIWERHSQQIGCAIVRDRAALEHRIFASPNRGAYRVVLEGDGNDAALVVSRRERRHGAMIGYVMEAMGGKTLADTLRSEVARLADHGAEIALAWCYPWSPNRAAFRRAGFFAFPERLRPVEFNFGAKAYSAAGLSATSKTEWYLSYLDSDGM